MSVRFANSISSPPAPRAFSLVELLVVMAVMLILLGIVAPAINSLGSSTRITNTAAAISDRLNQARTAAIVKNRHVEVRFYKLAGDNSQSDQFRATQSFELDDLELSQPRALSKVLRLPTGTVFHPDTQYSALLDASSDIDSGVAEVAGNADTPFFSFRFKPDGSTDLNPAGPNSGTPPPTWYVTIVEEKSLLGGLPQNYATILIAPDTGEVSVVRP